MTGMRVPMGMSAVVGISLPVWGRRIRALVRAVAARARAAAQSLGMRVSSRAATRRIGMRRVRVSTRIRIRMARRIRAIRTIRAACTATRVPR